MHLLFFMRRIYGATVAPFADQGLYIENGLWCQNQLPNQPCSPPLWVYRETALNFPSPGIPHQPPPICMTIVTSRAQGCRIGKPRTTHFEKRKPQEPS